MASLSRLLRADPPPASAPARVPGIPPNVFALYERGALPALESLPGIERECIELTYVDGLSVAEIAIRCAIDRAAVEDHVRRGLGRMLGYLSALAAIGADEAGRRAGVGGAAGTGE